MNEMKKGITYKKEEMFECYIYPALTGSKTPTSRLREAKKIGRSSSMILWFVKSDVTCKRKYIKIRKQSRSAFLFFDFRQ